MTGAAPVFDIVTLREMNLSSIDVMTKGMQRLRELRPEAAGSPMLQDHIDAEISTMALEIRIATIVQTRLQAANARVKPLDPDVVDKLTTLAATIDETIASDAMVSASLDTVDDLIANATELRDMVKSSTEIPAAQGDSA